MEDLIKRKIDVKFNKKIAKSEQYSYEKNKYLIDLYRPGI